ncbi:MAG TPA: vitamin K epoxide reductase family protein, partial [Gemmatimonadales bacterium]
MSAALLSLTGLFISAYLYLYKLGRIGSLACGTGGCETVQLSPWSMIAGVDVALIGVLGYAGLLAMTLAALQPGL